MSSCGETRQFWPEQLKLFSMFVPFLSWAVEWSYVACCRRDVRIDSRRVGLNAGDLPRTARLERCENTVADRMPARHCPSVGRIVLELIMIERRVVNLRRQRREGVESQRCHLSRLRDLVANS